MALNQIFMKWTVFAKRVICIEMGFFFSADVLLLYYHLDVICWDICHAIMLTKHRFICVFTWKRRMMVHMRPRVRRWFPSTMSWEPTFSRCTLCSFRNCRALSTFSRQWIRIRPRVGLGWGGIGGIINKNLRQKICSH